MSETAFRDRVYGCLVGGAIGDALGAPVEGWSHERIAAEHGEMDEFLPHGKGGPHERPGGITDDTALRHYLCMAAVRADGRPSPDDFAAVWREHFDPEYFWLNEHAVDAKLRVGESPWETGRGTLDAGCASMAIEPVGIVNAGDPEQAYRDGQAIAGVNQEGINRDAAAALAAGVATAFGPDPSVEDVVESVRAHCGERFGRAMDLTMALADDCGSLPEFRERFYAELLDWRWPYDEWSVELSEAGEVFSGNSDEFVPATLALLRFVENPERAIVEGASFGRDCDTIASIAGNIAGAIHGADGFPEAWKETVEAANTEFFEACHGDRGEGFTAMADRLVGVVESERDRARGRAADLDALLD